MTDTPGIEKFYGAAILLLRWWVLGWSREELEASSGVSEASIFNYERGKSVPGRKLRKKIAEAMDVSLAELDGLAAAVRRHLLGLGDRGFATSERLTAEVAADLAADFHRATLPQVARLVAEQAAPPPPAVSEEEVRALAPVLRRPGAEGPLQDLVRNLPSFWSWAFVKLVGEESARMASVDARWALDLASFALWVAERVPGDEGWVSQIFGWAWLANARRVGSDLPGAEEASACSARLRSERPEAELPEPWRLLDLEASLRIDLLQLPEALRLLDQAAELAPRSGPIRARILCIRSVALDRMEDPDGAIRVLREALAQTDQAAQPRLFCLLQSNLAESLACAGRAAEAEAMLPDLRRLQAQIGNGLNQIRMRWLEGKIDAGLGRLDRAIEALSRVRLAFAEADLRYDEAQAGLELAELYLKKGRTAEVRRLVRQMEPVFQAQGVHQEAQRALALFRRAVEKDKATHELASRVVRYLRRAEHDPKLVFQDAA